jgi:hypothetical protein
MYREAELPPPAVTLVYFPAIPEVSKPVQTFLDYPRAVSAVKLITVDPVQNIGESLRSIAILELRIRPRSCSSRRKNEFAFSSEERRYRTMFIRARSQNRFIVLTPTRLTMPEVFRNVDANTRRHRQLLAGMQRLRGRVYEADGAVRPSELTADGRHKLSVDENSWHVLSLDPHGEVVACLRFLKESHASGFDALRVRHAALARSPQHGLRFRRAVQREIDQARSTSIGFGEVGGWAVREDHRWTPESLRIVLATYALLELLGSSVGVATATFRHSSATILRRIGLSTLQTDGEEIPPYHDPQYGCLMQILRFDSRFPNPRYRTWVMSLMADLTNAPVVCRENLTGVLGRVWRGMDSPDLVPVLQECNG